MTAIRGPRAHLFIIDEPFGPEYAAPRPVAVEAKGTTVHVDGEPAFHLENPIVTRPQDWAPAARAILFPDAP